MVIEHKFFKLILFHNNNEDSLKVLNAIEDIFNGYDIVEIYNVNTTEGGSKYSPFMGMLPKHKSLPMIIDTRGLRFVFDIDEQLKLIKQLEG
jgi:hypothetical protein